MIKSFRAKIADNTIDTISLHTNNGSTGYKIKKLQIIQEQPGTANVECVVQVFTVKPATVPQTVDFSDNTLIGVGYYEDSGGSSGSGNPNVVIFDNTIVNQDIFVTYKDIAGTTPCNYHIELEQIKLDLTANTVATLKDIRNITGQ
tara:strand:- start:651 stop:1088 length:438 start_codon:yes stop_codon:yes gene_type:complete